MGWIEEKKKSLMRRLRGEYYTCYGDKVIYDEARGGIRHQYNFSPVDECRSEHLRVDSFGTESVIRYHLMEYSDDLWEAARKEAEIDHVWIFLVEDTIHELTHWAMKDSENSATQADDGEHSEQWRKVIYPLIEYVHEEVRIV